MGQERRVTWGLLSVEYRFYDCSQHRRVEDYSLKNTKLSSLLSAKYRVEDCSPLNCFLKSSELRTALSREQDCSL